MGCAPVFVFCCKSSIEGEHSTLCACAELRFWDIQGDKFNDRQARVLSRMFREGPEGFKGGMSAQKYTKITECSKATATRDLAELLKMGAFRKLEGGGRSTRCDINLLSTGRELN